VLYSFRLQHAILGLPLLFGDCIDQRQIVGDIDGAPDPIELTARHRELAPDVYDDDPPDQSDNDEKTRHHRGQARRLIRIDR
jgi:hypothetical protein